MPESPATQYEHMGPSMAKIYQSQEAEKAGRMVDEVIGSAPLLNYLDQRVTQYSNIEVYRSKDAPFFGPRPYGFGAKNLESHYEKETCQLYRYDGKVEIENALLEDTANSGMPKGEFFATESTKVLRAGVVLLDKILFYGPDLMEHVSPGLTQLIAPYMTVSANPAYSAFTEADHGTEAYENACNDTSGTSVYFIVKMDRGLEVAWGNGSGIRRGPIKDTEVYAKTVSGEMGSFEGKVQHFTAKMGLVNNQLYCIGRLKNITKTTGLTDDMIINAISEIFDGFDVEPTAIFMNKFARTLLRKSRSTVTKYVKGTSGNTTYANTPKEVDDTLIIIDNNILVDESKASIAAEGKKALLSVNGKATMKH